MKLLVCGPGHPFRGGIAQTTTELVRSLGRRGHELVFQTPYRQYPSTLFPGVNDRDPDACPRLACAQACLDPLNPGAWPEMRQRALETEAAAWIFPYWTWVWAPWWRYLLQGENRPPAVAVVHNPVDHEATLGKRVASRLVLCRCQALFTHAQSLAVQLRSEYPLTPIAFSLLGATSSTASGVDRARARARLGIDADVKLALFLGIIRPYKGVDILLEAFARLDAALMWRLVIAGEPWGGCEEELAQQVSRLGVQERVTLDLRWVPEQRIQDLLRAADLVVLPYRWGSQSAVAPMALAAGLPVLTTRVGGLAEAVKDGATGVIVAPGSVDELAQAWQGLDAQSLERLSNGARADAAHNSWQQYARALEKLVELVT